MAKYMDLEDNTVIAASVAPVVAGTSGDADGTTVDLLNYRYCTFIAQSGAEGDTFGAAVYFEFQVEESDDDSSWTDVADADLTTSVTSTSTDTGVFALINADGETPAIHSTTYIGNARYVRFVLLTGGTHSTGTPANAISIKHGAKVLPAA